ncbi:hypothetical protein M427DRAFT_59548 [Gonapodya prolifera JEL478]|uniref:Expansin-like EG45 domain-containing protein n=1 Tax=Gonapodya prolifera (strain JEL478) TaxID=1344416 RepID=A0A139A6R6_GONPJ|nr:hypothetical protein M427DRAFT_59548 [Gonapodya prolifera JEL478]|eukprot:KXS12394.1 hypothetical protein M427DRAFT_59548 [Gonapodya prolifera JEL478]
MAPEEDLPPVPVASATIEDPRAKRRKNRLIFFATAILVIIFAIIALGVGISRARAQTGGTTDSMGAVGGHGVQDASAPASASMTIRKQETSLTSASATRSPAAIVAQGARVTVAAPPAGYSTSASDSGSPTTASRITKPESTSTALVPPSASAPPTSAPSSPPSPPSSPPSSPPAAPPPSTPSSPPPPASSGPCVVGSLQCTPQISSGSFRQCSQTGWNAKACQSGTYCQTISTVVGNEIQCTDIPPTNSPPSSPPSAPPPPPPPASPPPPPASGSLRAYVSYHMYSAQTSLSVTSCSDGTNGLITRGYTMSSLFPAVGAASFATWNSPECGGCWALTNAANGVTVRLTVIDQCGIVGGYDAHFDISPDVFATLGGSQGVADGHVFVTYSKVSATPC